MTIFNKQHAPQLSAPLYCLQNGLILAFNAHDQLPVNLGLLTVLSIGLPCLITASPHSLDFLGQERPSVGQDPFMDLSDFPLSVCFESQNVLSVSLLLSEWALCILSPSWSCDFSRRMTLSVPQFVLGRHIQLTANDIKCSDPPKYKKRMPQTGAM